MNPQVSHSYFMIEITELAMPINSVALRDLLMNVTKDVVDLLVMLPSYFQTSQMMQLSSDRSSIYGGH